MELKTFSDLRASISRKGPDGINIFSKDKKGKIAEAETLIQQAISRIRSCPNRCTVYQCLGCARDKWFYNLTKNDLVPIEKAGFYEKEESKMELKTLKDLKETKQLFDSEIDLTGEVKRIVYYDDLRREAIKWAKEASKNAADGVYPNRNDAVYNWIRNFFNINLEELKND